jgi:hypothetical protein
MIDTATILIFSTLIVYTVVRAIKLDKLLPWFSDQDEQGLPPSKKDVRK